MKIKRSEIGHLYHYFHVHILISPKVAGIGTSELKNTLYRPLPELNALDCL